MIVLKIIRDGNLVTFKNWEVILGGLYLMYAGLYEILYDTKHLIKGFIYSSPIWILLASLIYFTIEFCA